MSAYDRVLRKVTDWQNDIESPEAGGRFVELLEQLRYLERVKFQPFLPALYSNRFNPSFMDRFEVWLNNPDLTEVDQQNLFLFAEHIAFFSFDDFVALFQSAFAGPVSRWCMDQAGIRMTNPDWLSILNEERYNRTWFCPITDSLLISLFHHVNEITDKERKPSFRDLAEFGNPEEVMAYIQKNEFTKLVLLEDFVGTGTQAMKAVKWALKKLDIPILFCPTIIGQEGLDLYSDLVEEVKHDGQGKFQCSSFCFEPIFRLTRDCFVTDGNKSPSDIFEKIGALSHKIHKALKSTNTHCSKGALGFCSKNSTLKGATAIMFSNAPNNSLPLLWHSAEEQWTPLFPRVARHSL